MTPKSPDCTAGGTDDLGTAQWRGKGTDDVTRFVFVRKSMGKAGKNVGKILVKWENPGKYREKSWENPLEMEVSMGKSWEVPK